MLTSDFRNFVKGVSARVNEIIDETINLVPNFQQTGLWKTQQSDGLVYRTQGVTGFAYLEQFDENGRIKNDKTYEAYQTEYVMKQFGLNTEISQMLMKTRESELESKLSEVRQHRIAVARSLDKHAWQVLVDSFSTSDSSTNFPTYRLGDGVALYSDSHPSLVTGVSNRSNRLSGDPLLTEANLFTAVKTVEEQLNGRGLPIGYAGEYALVVPPALRKTAIEITKSDQRSGTANNDTNFFTYTGGTMDVISNVYLGAANGGSDTAWYVFAKANEMNSMRYVSLIEPKIEQRQDFFTKTLNVSVDGSWAFGYSNFEMTAASDGTND